MKVNCFLSELIVGFDTQSYAKAALSLQMFAAQMTLW